MIELLILISPAEDIKSCFEQRLITYASTSRIGSRFP